MTVERRIRIRFAKPVSSDVHRVRNFGEELWRRTRNDRRYRFELEKVDRAVDLVEFTVRENLVKRAMAIVEDVLNEHMLTVEARIEID